MDVSSGSALDGPHYRSIAQFEEQGVTWCDEHGLHGDWRVQGAKRQGVAERRLICRPCAARYMREYYAAHPEVKRRAYDSLRGRSVALFHAAQRRAKQADLSCTVTPEWFVEQFERQNGRCAYTGWELDFTVTGHGNKRNRRGLSLDRFDPAEGYTPENTRLVCWAANRAKAERAMAEFLELCQAVAETHPRIVGGSPPWPK